MAQPEILTDFEIVAEAHRNLKLSVGNLSANGVVTPDDVALMM